MSFLSDIRSSFSSCKTKCDRAMAQLSDEQLFVQLSKHDNSIAIIIKHLWGNMRSRWTDFLNSDGEKPWRQRDAEFEATISSRAELFEKWEEGWQVLFAAIDSLKEEDLDRTVYIREKGHTVTQALLRQLAHYSSHAGQIVFLAKHLKGGEWESLSIPKGKSKEFNQQMFSKKV